MSYRTLKVVVGSHPETPSPPEEAIAASLLDRVAVVLDSYRPDRVDLYFDTELFLATSDAILQALLPDSLEIVRSATQPSLESLDALGREWLAAPEVEREPPELLRALRSGSVVCLAVPELWAQVGGPQPYHDSYTMSFFARFRSPLAVAESAAAAATALGAEASLVRVTDTTTRNS